MEYKIRHTFKPKIILPNIGFIDSCLAFMLSENRTIVTSDGFKCNVTDLREKHLCELESEILEIYKIDVWSWLKKWYGIDKGLLDMRMLVIELERI
jgi:hypothetical protein